ncbi:hypothetical protein K438DRAFT_1769919 [Mycena galopus ATCC 62051]|nr:hypothetical protein K438DRAFT_1769919 [Mycena galopus ATCC 62051]
MVIICFSPSLASSTVGMRQTVQYRDIVQTFKIELLKLLLHTEGKEIFQSYNMGSCHHQTLTFSHSGPTQYDIWSCLSFKDVSGFIDRSSNIAPVKLARQYSELQGAKRATKNPIWLFFSGAVTNHDEKVFPGDKLYCCLHGPLLYSSFVDYFSDDVNKHWNAYMTHPNLPPSTSSTRIPRDPQIIMSQSTFANSSRRSIAVEDESQNAACFFIYMNASPSNNPIQSEISAHIGREGRRFIVQELKKLVKLACSVVIKPVKDWSQGCIESELIQWTEDNQNQIYSSFLTMNGFDPAKDTPIELLHMTVDPRLVVLAVADTNVDCKISAHGRENKCFRAEVHVQRHRAGEIDSLNSAQNARIFAKGHENRSNLLGMAQKLPQQALPTCQQRALRASPEQKRLGKAQRHGKARASIENTISESPEHSGIERRVGSKKIKI